MEIAFAFFQQASRLAHSVTFCTSLSGDTKWQYIASAIFSNSISVSL